MLLSNSSQFAKSALENSSLLISVESEAVAKKSIRKKLKETFYKKVFLFEIWNLNRIEAWQFSFFHRGGITQKKTFRLLRAQKHDPRYSQYNQGSMPGLWRLRRFVLHIQHFAIKFDIFGDSRNFLLIRKNTHFIAELADLLSILKLKRQFDILFVCSKTHFQCRYFWQSLVFT